MATAREIKEKVYFDEIYTVLEEFKARLYALRDELAKTYGKDSSIFVAHDRHLLDMAEYMDWKMQVLEKGTSFDWKIAKGERENIESDVSVLPTVTPAGPDFSGGYVGG